MLPRGVCAYPITPSDTEGRVDVAGLRKLVGRLGAAGVDAIGVLGSTGTYAYLSRAERRRALDAALGEAGGLPVLAGVGALRTDEAIRLAEDARDAGATAGLIAAVSYTPLTEDEVFAHVVAVAGASGLPLCLYDNPATTHFRFSPALVERLAGVDGIVAVKSPAPDGAAAAAAHVAQLRARVPEDFSLGYSGDWNATEALLAGGDLWHSVVAGLLPRRAVALARAATGGDADAARRLDAQLEPLWALFRAYSSLRVVHAAADFLGLCHAAPPRPILPLAGAARRQVEAVIAALGEA